MKIKFEAILTIEKALKAVESDGDALRYVLDKELFTKIASICKIEIEF